MSKPAPPPTQTTLDLSAYPVDQNGDGYEVRLASGSGKNDGSLFDTGVHVGLSPTGAGIDAPITITGVLQTGTIPLTVTTVIGSAGSDTLAGADYTTTSLTLNGGAGNDYIEGNMGNDTLIGGAGNDVLIASWGNNTMWGGNPGDSPATPSTDADTFAILTDYPSGHVHNTDTIMDFNDNDTLVFTLLSNGVSAAPTSWQVETVGGVESLVGVTANGGTTVVLEGFTDLAHLHELTFNPQAHTAMLVDYLHG